MNKVRNWEEKAQKAKGRNFLLIPDALIGGEEKNGKQRKKYFKDLYNVEAKEQANVSLFGSEEARRGNYFRLIPVINFPQAGWEIYINEFYLHLV